MLKIYKNHYASSNNWLERILIIFMLIQLGMICFVNIFQQQYHLGYDTSVYYLQAMEMANQGKLVLDNWAYQTTLGFDSSVPLAAILYKIIGNIYISYGIANITIGACLVTCFYSILKKLKLRKTTSILCLNLLLSFYIIIPNLANDLGYSAMLFTSCAAYNVKLLIILLLITVMIGFNFDINTKKEKALYIITICLILLSSISSGYYILAFGIAPFVLYLIVKMFLTNDIKVLISKPMIYLIVNLVVVVIGKTISLNILGFASKDSTMVWTGLVDFWKNIGSIFLGFTQLLQGLPINSDTNMLEAKGIAYAFNLIVIILCITSIIYFFKKGIKEVRMSSNFSIVSSVIIGNLLVFTFTYTTYGAAIFEERYLIPIFFVAIMLVGYFIDSLDDKLLLKKIGTIGIIGCLIMSNAISYHGYINVKNNYDTLVIVTEYIRDQEIPLVYVYGRDIDIDARNIRTIDGSRVYKYIIDEGNMVHHWGDYTYFDENGDYEGKTAIIATNQSFEKLPVYIKKWYTLEHTIGIYNIYLSEENKFDFISGLPEEEKSIDFPYTPGIITNNLNLDENGEYITNGEGGHAMYGPNTQTKSGKYSFTLNYEIISFENEEIGAFDVVLNNGTVEKGSILLDRNKTSVIIKDVVLENDTDTIEYRVWVHPNSIIKIKSVEIVAEEE